MDFEQFNFKGLHPQVFMGTASDRYAGWIGQIYSPGRYDHRITRRTKKLAGKSFLEEVLPVESVEEYFLHFPVLELDFTFYRPLLDKDRNPTQNHHALRTYSQYLKDGDRVILKVPQAVFANKMFRAGKYLQNEQYLDPHLFVHQFYEPAQKILGSALAGLVFEQEYQRKKDRVPQSELAGQLGAFFEAVPEDERYHVELRTEAYLTGPVLDVFEKHGLGQVLSHWTWLPSLLKQFALGRQTFFNTGKNAIIRLMTPRGTRYQDAYARAHPFDDLAEGMLSGQMVRETGEIMQAGIEAGTQINVIINNRAGGNAPLIACQIARQFLAGEEK